MVPTIQTMTTFDQMLAVLIMAEEFNAARHSGQGGDYI